MFEAECADHIPIVKTSVAGTTLVGRMTVGTVFPSPVPSPAHRVLRHDSVGRVMPQCWCRACSTHPVQLRRIPYAHKDSLFALQGEPLARACTAS